MVDYNALGVRIRLARRRAKLTQEQLAEKAGISTSFMGHVERGSRILSLETLVMLAKALGVTLDELVIGKDMPVDEVPEASNGPESGRSMLAQQVSDLSNLLIMAQKRLADIESMQAAELE